MIRALLATLLLSGCAAERNLFKEDPVPIIAVSGIFAYVASQFVE